MGSLVRLKNWDGEIIALFAGTGRGLTGGGMQGYSYYKQLRKPGEWMLRIDGNDERIGLFLLDYQIEFWRSDPAGGLGWYLGFEGFVRDWEFTLDESGKEVFIARGRGYNDLLLAEPIRYYAGSEYATKSGACETVAKAYVNENIGPAATSPPRNRSGVMPGLTIEADRGTGATWSGGRPGKNLLDVLVELADYAPGDFMVVGTGPAAYEFQWRANQWGEDKTWGNADGRPAVVFDPLLGNVRSLNYVYDRRNEINTVDVLGQGSGDQRRVVTRTSGAENDSPWARRAVVRDARNTYDTDGLNRSGDDVIDKQRAKIKISVTVAQTPATRYVRDWDIGDLPTVRYRSANVPQKIVGVQVSVDDNGVETIQGVMEDP